MAYTIEFDFDDGNGWTDVTHLVQQASLKKSERLWSDLKATANTAQMTLDWDSNVWNKLLTTDTLATEILVRIQESSSDWFTGLVRDTFKARSSQLPSGISVECVDYSQRLDKRMKWTGALANYKVCDTANQSTSLLHYLLTQEGSGITLNVSDIDKTVPYYVNVDGYDEKTFAQALSELLFEFGYTYGFNASGEFVIYDLFPASTTTSDDFDGTNIRGELTITKRREKFDGVRVEWWDLGSETNAIVFNDTTGGSGSEAASIDVANGDCYPGSCSDDTYAEYQFEAGDVVAVTSATLDVEVDGMTQTTFTNQFRRAALKYTNSTGSTATITKMQIKGTVQYRRKLNFTQSSGWVNSDFRQDIKTQYINAEADAQKLATGLRRYYKFSDFKYSLNSEADFAIGHFIDVVDSNLGINNRCIIVGKSLVDVTQDLWRYELEGIAEYSSETTASASQKPSQPPLVSEVAADTPTFEELDNGYVATSGGTKTPTVPTLSVIGAYKGFVLFWDRQATLTNFSRYELQVSDDDTNWYSLATVSDWKDALGADTDVYQEIYVHTPLPFGGTSDAPTALTLYYRVRRVTKDGTESNWSTSVSATNSTVETGDIAENSITANKIAVAVLNALVANINSELVIDSTDGWVAGNPTSPTSGDRRIKMDQDVIASQEWDGSAWQTLASLGYSSANSRWELTTNVLDAYPGELGNRVVISNPNNDPGMVIWRSNGSGGQESDSRWDLAVNDSNDFYIKHNDTGNVSLKLSNQSGQLVIDKGFSVGGGDLITKIEVI